MLWYEIYLKGVHSVNHGNSLLNGSENSRSEHGGHTNKFSETAVYCDTDSLTKNKSKRYAAIIFKREMSFAKKMTKMKGTCIKHDSCSV